MNRDCKPLTRLFQDRHAWLLIVWLSAAAYLVPRAGRGWIPHDEGLLGQSAVRVLSGELPHRDFDDPYTGGLACLHAFVFRCAGVDLYWLRATLLLVSLVYVPVVYSIAARVLSPAVAGVTTLLCVVWSVPNYFAALPSWYNLFFAVFGTWALLRYLDSHQHRWLLLAGLMGGLSILIKVTGAYYVAAAILFLVYDEQIQASASPRGTARGVFPLFSAACLVVFVAAVVRLVRQRFTLMDALHFVLPAAVLALFLALHEWRLGPRSDRARWRRLGLAVATLGLGVAIPLALFLVPYAASSSIPAFYHGVFVLPQKRWDSAAYPLPVPATLVAVLPLAVLLVMGSRGTLPTRSMRYVALTGFVCGVLAWSGRNEFVYSAIWNSLRPLVPLVTVVGCWLLASRSATESPAPQRREILFLLLAMAAMVSLVQYPYAFGIYFCYAAPLVILAFACTAASQPSAPGGVHLCVLFLYLAFGLLWVNRGYVRTIGVKFASIEENTILDPERANLRVLDRRARLYQDVVAEIRRHSDTGAFIYATADCPEIYFLSDRANPTRTFYDVFESDFQADPPGRVRRILAILDERNVKVVVLRWSGEFSGELSTELVQALQVRFPAGKHFGYFPETPARSPPVFTVAWRE